MAGSRHEERPRCWLTPTCPTLPLSAPTPGVALLLYILSSWRVPWRLLLRPTCHASSELVWAIALAVLSFAAYHTYQAGGPARLRHGSPPSPLQLPPLFDGLSIIGDVPRLQWDWSQPAGMNYTAHAYRHAHTHTHRRTFTYKHLQTPIFITHAHIYIHTRRGHTHK